MPLAFAADAAKKAIQEVECRYAHTTCVHATRQITCFYHHNEIVALPGNLHDKIEADFCVEYDIVYSHGNAIIRDQRIFN